MSMIKRDRPPPRPTLSICITTFNRAAFIGATLDSILVQLTEACEVVVLDGGSTDRTQEIVSEYARRFEHLRYVRQNENNSFDRDCDRAVQLANGEYCWLASDDDLIKPGAISIVLEALRSDLSLIVLNVEYRDFNMANVVQPAWLKFSSDRLYEPAEMDRLFVEAGDRFWYAGGLIIKRELWLARERERYYGSWFVFVGVIFQKQLPGKALVIANSYISYRVDNTHTFSSHIREILYAKWPSLLSSLALTSSAREAVRSAEPWKSPQWLLVLRGWGLYSLSEYRRWIAPRVQSVAERFIAVTIAILPGVVVNLCFVLYYSIRRDRGRLLHHMKRSRFHPRNWAVFKREWGVRSRG